MHAPKSEKVYQQRHLSQAFDNLCKILCISILIYTTILKRWFKKEEVFCLSLSGTSIQYTQETNLLSICNTTRASWES